MTGVNIHIPGIRDRRPLPAPGFDQRSDLVYRCSITYDIESDPSRTSALRALLQAEQDRSPDFVRLANALLALYPRIEEKRLLDVMLLALPKVNSLGGETMLTESLLIPKSWGGRAARVSMGCAYREAPGAGSGLAVQHHGFCHSSLDPPRPCSQWDCSVR